MPVTASTRWPRTAPIGKACGSRRSSANFARSGEGIAGWVAESRRGVVLGDTEHHPKAAHVVGTDVIDESMLAVPVAFEDEVLAVIVVLKLGLNQYSLDQLRLL